MTHAREYLLREQSIRRWTKFWQAQELTEFCSIRYPDPAIKINDTVKINLETGKQAIDNGYREGTFR
jgi:hypothetical protein